MEKENKLKCILINFEQGEITLSEASNTILRLFSVSNSVICCPQCGNERLENTGGGWYICADRGCDWGGKL